MDKKEKKNLVLKTALPMLALLLTSCGGLVQSSGEIKESISSFSSEILSSSSEASSSSETPSYTLSIDSSSLEDSSEDVSSEEYSSTSVYEESSEESSVEESSLEESSEQSSAEESSEELISSEEASSEASSEISSEEEDLFQYVINPEDLKNTPWKNVDLTNYGIYLRDELADLINATSSKTIGYSSNNSILAKSDESPYTPGKVVPFYRDDHSVSSSWNKEHVWPNSRGAGESGPGADPQMLRPTNKSDNSDRGNNVYGVAGVDANTWDPASFGYEAARGESARIIFYTATRYGKSHGLYLNEDTSYIKGKTKYMGKLSRLIEWNNAYPVTAMEKLRNERLVKLGFARNPFIDCPNLANYIWTEAGYRKGSLPLWSQKERYEQQKAILVEAKRTSSTLPQVFTVELFNNKSKQNGSVTY